MLNWRIWGNFFFFEKCEQTYKIYYTIDPIKYALFFFACACVYVCDFFFKHKFHLFVVLEKERIEKKKLHNNLWLWNTGLYAFMWQNLTTIYVNFIFYNDIFAQNGNALHTHPTSDCWPPTNYTTVKPCMAFNNCTFQNCGTLDTGTCGQIDRFSVLFINWIFFCHEAVKWPKNTLKLTKIKRFETYRLQPHSLDQLLRSVQFDIRFQVLPSDAPIHFQQLFVFPQSIGTILMHLFDAMSLNTNTSLK